MCHVRSSLSWLLILQLAIGGLLAGLFEQAHATDSVVESSPQAPYFFIVAADPQLLMNQKDDRHWVETIEHVNRLKPEFLIVCGDLLNASNKSADWSLPKMMKNHNRLADMYLNAAKKLDPEISLRNVAGNHDVSLQPTPEILKWFSEKFGPPWYSFEHKNSLFVTLESDLLRDEKGAPGEGREQMNWLRETLNAAKEKQYDHVTVYLHHPICLKEIGEPDQYFNIPRVRRVELIKMFEEADVKVVFSGHLHKNAYVKHGDLELVTTSSCGAPLGKDPRGFRIVKVYPDRLEHEYVSFDKMPAKVEFDETK